MRHTVVESISEMMGLESAWSDLLIRCDRDFLPMTHFWTMNWWTSFGAQRQPQVHCFYEADKLVALAPMCIESAKFRNIGVRQLASMINGHSPWGDLLLDRNLDAAQIETVLSTIAASTSLDLTCFSRLPPDSRALNLVRHRSRIGSYPLGLREGFSTPLIRIDSDWETFFAKRSQKFRKGIRNKVNKFNKADGCRIERIAIASAADPVIKEMFAISRNSWKGKVGTDLETWIESRAFTTRLIDKLGPAGGACVWIARCGDIPIAFELHASYNGVTYPVRADFDENYRQIAPGSVVEYTALYDLFKEGKYSLYDSCAKEYWYLSNWTSEYRTHFDLEIFGRGLKSRALHAFEYLMVPAFRQVRSVLKRPPVADGSPQSSH